MTLRMKVTLGRTEVGTAIMGDEDLLPVSYTILMRSARMGTWMETVIRTMSTITITE